MGAETTFNIFLKSVLYCRFKQTNVSTTEEQMSQIQWTMTGTSAQSERK